MTFKKIILISFSFVLLAFLYSCNNSNLEYFKNTGTVHGTFYNIQYEYTSDIKQDIELQTKIVDASLSTFVPTSTISKINKNESVVLDSLFLKVFNCAKQVSEKTDGTFDITVAPLVNAWGFGFTDSIHTDSLVIDSIMQFVGFNKIKLENDKIVKENNGTMLDASAIAKGFSIDFVSEYLESLGIKNYLVEIGGEVRAKGKNKEGKFWVVGIDKPIFEQTASDRELQEIISLENRSIATSGNYRQFYVKNNVMYSHTINPKTGYPAHSSILSASVIAPNCMIADAYATAFMVVGVNKAMEIANNDKTLDIYLIYSDEKGKLAVKMTEGFKKFILKQ